MSLSESNQTERRFRVLVVDDDQEIGYMLQRLLGGPQTVTLARDGYEALERIKSASYGLVFLDVRLPGMDGIEALESIKSLRPDTIVVMMSGYPGEQVVRQAMALGAHDFLQKPFADIDQITTMAEVARYLNVHDLTVRRLARDGDTPTMKTGRQWRAKRELLDRWIEREATRHVRQS